MYQMRKLFNSTIKEIELQGRHIEDIEAFSISTNDFRQLKNMFYKKGYSANHVALGGQMKMCGVKIVEGQYVPDGTIFKVFKNAIEPGPISSYHPDGSLIGTSGVIPNLNMPATPGLPTPIIPDHYDYEKQDTKETESVDTRHSTKRRIELDE